MKPEELDQLIETLTGIRAGKPWIQTRAGTLQPFHAKHRTKRPLPVEPDPVPLCKDDIPTGSGLRNLKFYPDMAWVGISRVGVNGVATANGVFYSYETLAAEGSAWEIQRPGQSWQPCSKEAPAP
jgi:hypothetical protein